MSTVSSREIDSRFMPPVKGIDLEQALNYIDLDDVSAEFIDRQYTSSRLPYNPGSRPAIEKAAKAATDGTQNRLEQVAAIANYVATHFPWAGYYQRKKGIPLAADRALREEELLASGYGWCNEQARVFCCLTQAVGLPSRLVFASNKELNFGHVTSEVLMTPTAWLLVDQSLGFLFLKKETPVSAYAVYHVPENRAFFSPVYQRLCKKLMAELGPEIINSSFRMAGSADPLRGFQNLGYHNHFLI